MRKLLIPLLVVVSIMTGCGNGGSEAVIEDSGSLEKGTEQAVSEETETPDEPAQETVEDAGESAEVVSPVSEEERTPEAAEPIFEIHTIDEERVMFMTDKSYYDNDHIAIENLRYVEVGYIGFDGEAHQGALVVHEVIAEDILTIFEELYKGAYPIERIEPVAHYDGDDDASMAANNTSAFNFRVVSGTEKLSNHAYGLAVDINPLINPWVTSSGEVFPPEGEAYTDRTLDQQGMIKKDDLCYKAFVSRGFRWGGDWKNSKDYQHFDIKVDGINQ